MKHLFPVLCGLAVLNLTFAPTVSAQVPRLENITIVEDGETFPTVSNQGGTVMVTPGKLLKERNVQSLVRLLETYAGWPANGPTVEAIGRAVASWGRGNSVYFNLLAPISIPTSLTLALYPKGEGPSYLTYTQPQIHSPYVTESSNLRGAPNYWIDVEESARASGYTSGTMGGDWANKVRRLESEKAKLRDLLRRLAGELKQTRQTQVKIQKIESQKAKLQSVLDNLYDEVRTTRTVRNDMQDIQRERAQLRGMVNNLSSKLAHTQAEERQVSVLRDERDRLKQTVAKLSRELQETRRAQQNVSSLESEKNEVRSTLEKLAREFQNTQVTQDRLQQVEGERDRLQAVLDRLSRQLQTSRMAQSRIQQVESEKARLQSTLDRLGDQIHSSELSQERFRQLQSEKEQLRTMLDRLSDELRKARLAQNRVQQVEAEKAQLQTMLNNLSRELNQNQAVHGYMGASSQGGATYESSAPKVNLRRDSSVRIETSSQTRQNKFGLRSGTSQRDGSVIEKVIILDENENELEAAYAEEDVVVRVNQLPSKVISQIEESAGALLYRPFSVDTTRQVGAEIGKALSQYGMTNYEVVLPQQNVHDGTLGLRIRRIN